MRNSKIEDKSTHQEIKEYLAEKNKQESLVLRFSRVIIPIVAILLVLIAIIFSLQKKDMPLKISDQEALDRGLIKSMGGRVISVDTTQNQFIIDISEFVKKKRYIIIVGKDTNFSSIQFNTSPVNAETLDFLEEKVETIATEMPRGFLSFGMIKGGMRVEVQFADYINLDTASLLVADKVIIFRD